MLLNDEGYVQRLALDLTRYLFYFCVDSIRRKINFTKKALRHKSIVVRVML